MNKVKKSGKTMRAAMLLLVLTLITSCFVGGTFAKYVTAGTATDTARVAKWGVTVTGSGAGIFKSNYDDTVVGTSAAKVIAPGTTGSLADYTITGTPETDGKITFTVDKVDLSDAWTVTDTLSNIYMPVEFSVNSTPVSITPKSSITDLESELKTKIQAALDAETVTFEAGTDLSTINTTDTLTLTWEWPFYKSDANDILDTELGDLGTAPTITVDISAVVTQVD